MMKPTYRTFEVAKCRDLLSLVAARNGDTQNASEIGRQLGISYHAVFRRIDTLESLGMIRVLRAPKSRRSHVLLRDCRLLQALGGSPLGVMRTCLTECIVRGLSGGPLTCWESGRVKRVDLVARTEKEKIGFAFSQTMHPRNLDLASLRLAAGRRVIDRGFLVHRGEHPFIAARVVIALPVGEFLGNLDRWLACRSFKEAHGLLRERLQEGLARPAALDYPPASCAFAVSTIATMFSAEVSAGAAPAGASM
jgi:hypothetical protein